jgi:hypothetical protein
MSLPGSSINPTQAKDVQHDFMYDNMIPTMQSPAQTRNAVTSAPKRADLKIYRFASSTASKPLLFNWQECTNI